MCAFCIYLDNRAEQEGLARNRPGMYTMHILLPAVRGHFVEIIF